MSGNLRDALLKLTGDLVARAEKGEPHLFLTVPLRDLEALLAAHPAVPAPVVTDEAVEAAASAYWESERHSDELHWPELIRRDPDEATAYRDHARLHLEAAAPLLGPRPLLDQQAVANVIYAAVRAQAGPAIASLVGTEALSSLMELARPMPTRNRIAGYLRDSAQTLDKGEEWHLADGLLTLIGGDAE